MRAYAPNPKIHGHGGNYVEPNTKEGQSRQALLELDSKSVVPNFYLKSAEF